MSHYDFFKAYVEMKKAQLNKTNTGEKIISAEENNTSDKVKATAPNGKTYGPVIIGETTCDEYGVYGILIGCS